MKKIIIWPYDLHSVKILRKVYDFFNINYRIKRNLV